MILLDGLTDLRRAERVLSGLGGPWEGLGFLEEMWGVCGGDWGSLWAGSQLSATFREGVPAKDLSNHMGTPSTLLDRQIPSKTPRTTPTAIPPKPSPGDPQQPLWDPQNNPSDPPNLPGHPSVPPDPQTPPGSPIYTPGTPSVPLEPPDPSRESPNPLQEPQSSLRGPTPPPPALGAAASRLPLPPPPIGRSARLSPPSTNQRPSSERWGGTKRERGRWSG